MENKPKNNTQPLDKSQIEDLAKKGISDFDIAKKFNCSRSKIVEFRKLNNIDKQKPKKKVKHLKGKSTLKGVSIPLTHIPNQSQFIQPAAIDPNTALWYVQKELERVKDELSKTQIELNQTKSDLEKKKDDVRDLKNQIDSKPAGGLNGLLDSMAETPTAIAPILAELRGFFNDFKSKGDNKKIMIAQNTDQETQQLIQQISELIEKADKQTLIQISVVLQYYQSQPAALTEFYNTIIAAMHKQQSNQQ